jgi:hypothetical protein
MNKSVSSDAVITAATLGINNPKKGDHHVFSKLVPLTSVPVDEGRRKELPEEKRFFSAMTVVSVDQNECVLCGHKVTFDAKKCNHWRVNKRKKYQAKLKIT